MVWKIGMSKNRAERRAALAVLSLAGFIVRPPTEPHWLEVVPPDGWTMVCQRGHLYWLIDQEGVAWFETFIDEDHGEDNYTIPFGFAQ